MPSPTPTSLTGRPSSCAIASATPPFAEPSSFVSATPRDLDGLAEELRLPDAVLAGRGVDHEQRLVRRALEAALDHAPDLRQLLHQVRLRVQAAGRVDDDDVAAAGRAASIAS